MAWSRNRLISALRELSTEKEEAFFKTTEEYNDIKGGIWTGAEGNPSVEFEVEGMNLTMPMWDYYEYTPGGINPNWEGELPEVRKLLKKAGWFSEFEDPGTVTLWKE